MLVIFFFSEQAQKQAIVFFLFTSTSLQLWTKSRALHYACVEGYDDWMSQIEIIILINRLSKVEMKILFVDLF